MRVTRIILIVLGILLIVLNGIGFLGGVTPFLKDPTEPMINRIAFFIGSTAVSILGLLLLFIAWLINIRIKRKENKKMVDSLFNE